MISKDPRSLLRMADRLVRSLRPHILPSHRKAYAALLKRGLDQYPHGRPIACFDLADQSIDAVGGRYYFSFIRDVIDAGFFPVFVAWRGTVSSFGSSRFKSLLLPEALGFVRSADEIPHPFIWITDRRAETPANAVKIVRVNYGLRMCSNPGELPFPFFVHPKKAGLAKSFRGAEPGRHRNVRIFFGGKTSDEVYGRSVLGLRYGMLSRREMLDVACSLLPKDQINKPDDAMRWLASADEQRMTLFETQHCRVPSERWLDALAKADFFLACPGADMPLCHNLIEAITAGAIPILQYARYLTPALEHGVNCLAFHDAQSLREAVASALRMDEADIRKMRENVMRYHELHLAPGCFAERLFAGPQRERSLLLNDYRFPRS
jgi:hypothetical protein